MNRSPRLPAGMLQVISIILVVFASCFTAGCRDAGPSPEDESAGPPVPGDMYIAGSIGDATYLNPVLSSDTASSDINNLVYNGLVKYDKNIVLTGDLAESWTVSPDGLVVTFKLRRGVRWHDGEPFTAEDVRFTWLKLTDPSVKTPYSSDYLLVKSLEVVDPYTVRITYRERFAPALESWGIGIIPKHVFEKGDFNSHPANRRPVGTGPFRFKEWISDEKIVLESNPDYFEGQPLIGRYVYRIIPDQAVQFLELRNQSIDEMGLTPDQWKAYPEFFRHYRKFEYPSFTFVFLGFNLELPLFRDIRFRRAVAYALDKREIIDGVLLGMGSAANGPFPPQSWANDHTVPDYPYDPARARALLAEMGWKDTDGDGYLDKNGKPLGFTILSNQGNRMRELSALIVQAQLKKIGIRVQVRIIEWSAFIHEFVDKKKFEAIILGWSLARDPDQYPLWHSSQTGPGKYNFISYVNPEIDRLLEDGRRTFDRDEREKIYHRMHRIMSADLPCIFLYYPEALPVIHKRFVGPELAPAGIGWNFPKWGVPYKQQRYKLKA